MTDYIILKFCILCRTASTECYLLLLMTRAKRSLFPPKRILFYLHFFSLSPKGILRYNAHNSNLSIALTLISSRSTCLDCCMSVFGVRCERVWSVMTKFNGTGVGSLWSHLVQNCKDFYKVYKIIHLVIQFPFFPPFFRCCLKYRLFQLWVVSFIKTNTFFFN